MSLKEFRHFTVAAEMNDSGEYILQVAIEAHGDEQSLPQVQLEYRKVYSDVFEDIYSDPWQPYQIGDSIQEQSANFVGVQFRNSSQCFTDNTDSDSDNYYHLVSDYQFRVGGKISSLHYAGDDGNEYEINQGAFFKFMAESPVTDASELVMALNSPSHCYQYLFYNCEKLIQPPELPCDGVSEYCYSYMFSGCVALQNAPELNAPFVGESSYECMFENCTSLALPPDLTAMDVSPRSYLGMFYGCSNLQYPPTIGATRIPDQCCNFMFYECTSLCQPPQLPALEVDSFGYSGMFQGSGIQEAPDLPATTLGEGCYREMFSSCVNLLKGPSILPATQLKQSCYSGMFMYCYSLKEAPDLPATTLVSGSYERMFYDCGALKNLKINATTLSSNVSEYMLFRCTSLEKLTFGGTTINSTSFLSNNNKAGVLECTNPNAKIDPTKIVRGANGIPTNWTIKYIEPEKSGLSMSINGVPASKLMILGKTVKSMSINGHPVKAGGAQYGTDIDIPYQKTLWTANPSASSDYKLDTGVIVSDHMKIGMKWVYPSRSGSWPMFFGSYTSNGYAGDWTKQIAVQWTSGYGYTLMHYLRSKSKPTQHTFIYADWVEKTPSQTVHSMEITPTHWTVDGTTVDIIEQSDNVCRVDNVTDAEMYPQALVKQSFYLFGDRTTSNVTNRCAVFRCYNFYIIDTITNEVLINLIPCVVDGVGMFYDTASKRLIYASKPYEAGPVVN